jgi:hypothetical protein
VGERWQFDYRPSEALPPLAWVARLHAPSVEVDCGMSVTREESGFFEGTWVGGPGLGSVVESTTPFGSGMVATADGLFIVPPGHTLSGIYAWRDGADTIVSNTLVGLLAAADVELRPDTDYVTRFFGLADGIDFTPIELPTSGAPVEFHFYENLHVGTDGRLEKVAKRREDPFKSYADYVGRLQRALEQALANAPDYRPVIALSNGYDSTAMAVVAARVGCRTALTFAHARPPIATRDASDSGERTARRLGMDVEFFDWQEYMRRDDLPEAEFLATGYTGEDVAVAAMEPSLRRTALITGGVGSAMWRRGREKRSDLQRGDLSACSMTEFRLRVDFIDLTLPIFGMSEIPSLQDITLSEEMRPWSIGGYYDKPIARRIAEEGGIPRGTFADAKRAATALLHQQGAAAMAPATVESVRAFAAAESGQVDLSPRKRLTKLDRAFMRVTHALHVDSLATRQRERFRTIVHHSPRTGSILFRWGVAQIRPRYESLRPPVS